MDSKQLLEDEILSAVDYLEETFGKGLKLGIISRKLSKQARKHGYSVRGLVDELHKRKKLFKFVDENLETLLMSAEMHEAPIYDEYGELTRGGLNLINSKWGKPLVKDDVEEEA